MRLLGLIVALLILAGCSDDKSGLTPAERAKKARGMSEDIWKVYSGTESGVDDGTTGKPQQPPAKPEPPKGTQ
jgi:hypothetical protein